MILEKLKISINHMVENRLYNPHTEKTEEILYVDKSDIVFNEKLIPFYDKKRVTEIFGLVNLYFIDGKWIEIKFDETNPIPHKHTPITFWGGKPNYSEINSQPIPGFGDVDANQILTGIDGGSNSPCSEMEHKASAVLASLKARGMVVNDTTVFADNDTDEDN